MLCLLLVFSFVVLVVSFFQKSICLVWVRLSTFWCFTISFLDLSIVFKRLNYPVHKLVKSGLGTVGFLDPVMLLVCGLWCLVTCVG